MLSISIPSNSNYQTFFQQVNIDNFFLSSLNSFSILIYYFFQQLPNNVNTKKESNKLKDPNMHQALISSTLNKYQEFLSVLNELKEENSKLKSLIISQSHAYSTASTGVMVRSSEFFMDASTQTIEMEVLEEENVKMSDIENESSEESPTEEGTLEAKIQKMGEKIEYYKEQKQELKELLKAQYKKLKKYKHSIIDQNLLQDQYSKFENEAKTTQTANRCLFEELSLLQHKLEVSEETSSILSNKVSHLQTKLNRLRKLLDSYKLNCTFYEIQLGKSKIIQSKQQVELQQALSKFLDMSDKHKKIEAQNKALVDEVRSVHDSLSCSSIHSIKL